MNSDSPVSSRLPAPISAPRNPPCCLLRAVAEDGLHLDAVVHVHHAAGLGHRGFVRIQFDFDELQVIAKNLVVDLVHVSHVGMLPDAYFFASSS